jgi:hypothetical protein
MVFLFYLVNACESKGRTLDWGVGFCETEKNQLTNEVLKDPS